MKRYIMHKLIPPKELLHDGLAREGHGNTVKAAQCRCIFKPKLLIICDLLMFSCSLHEAHKHKLLVSLLWPHDELGQSLKYSDSQKVTCNYIQFCLSCKFFNALF